MNEATPPPPPGDRPHRVWRSGVMALLAATRFVANAFTQQWHAAPVALVAATLSTASAACFASVSYHWLEGRLGTPFGIAVNSVASAAIAYASYLAIYYAGMLHVERRAARRRARHDASAWAGQWRRTAWADFLLHLPSDLYLLAGIATAQGTLVGTDLAGPFWAAVCSNLATDVYTTLREPLYWRAAQHLAQRGAKPGETSDQPRS